MDDGDDAAVFEDSSRGASTLHFVRSPFSAALPAQMLMQGSGPAGAVRIFNTDAAILESQEPRKDLPCTVTPIKADLGFDLKFHAGYDVSIPLKDLAGSENLLTMIFRVTPENRPDEPVYFSQRVSVPAIEENAKGDAYLQGIFDVGEGKLSRRLADARPHRAHLFVLLGRGSRAAGQGQDMALEIAPGIIAAVRPGAVQERAAGGARGPATAR